MREQQRELGMSILLITHDLGVVAEMARQVAVMYLGRIVEQAAVQAIYADPRHPYTRALLKSIPGRAPRKTALHAIPGSVPVLSSGFPAFRSIPAARKRSADFAIRENGAGVTGSRSGASGGVPCAAAGITRRNSSVKP